MRKSKKRKKMDREIEACLYVQEKVLDDKKKQKEKIQLRQKELQQQLKEKSMRTTVSAQTPESGGKRRPTGQKNFP